MYVTHMQSLYYVHYGGGEETFLVKDQTVKVDYGAHHNISLSVAV